MNFTELQKGLSQFFFVADLFYGIIVDVEVIYFCIPLSNNRF